MNDNEINILHMLGTLDKGIIAKANNNPAALQTEIARYIRAVYIQMGNDQPTNPVTGGNYTVIPKIPCN